MTRDEMMARMSGQEFSAWGALFTVKDEEREHAEHMADSGDGVVIYSGDDRDEEPDDDEDEESNLIPDGD
jgi:hypothetical protein